MGNDYVHLHLSQFRCETRKALNVSVRKAPLNGQVFPLDVAELLHFLHERIQINVRT